MPQWQEGYVQSNGIRLHYTRTDGDKAPMVLVHGLTDNGLAWTRFANVLQATYDLVMVDARGHGLPEGTRESAAYPWSHPSRTSAVPRRRHPQIVPAGR